MACPRYDMRKLGTASSTEPNTASTAPRMPPAAIRAMPTRVLKRMRSQATLLGVSKRTARPQVLALSGLQAELEQRRAKLVQEVELDALLSGEQGHSTKTQASPCLTLQP